MRDSMKLLAWSLAALLTVGHTLTAQGGARLAGRVLVKSTKVGVAHAQVAQLGGPAVTTDSAGRFALRNVSRGTVHLLVRAIGYEPSEVTIGINRTDFLYVAI